MDRLLTQEEALEASLQDKENGLDIITIYLKAQDAKTASLVGKEIFEPILIKLRLLFRNNLLLQCK